MSRLLQADYQLNLFDLALKACTHCNVPSLCVYDLTSLWYRQVLSKTNDNTILDTDIALGLILMPLVRHGYG